MLIGKIPDFVKALLVLELLITCNYKVAGLRNRVRLIDRTCLSSRHIRRILYNHFLLNFIENCNFHRKKILFILVQHY